MGRVIFKKVGEGEEIQKQDYTKRIIFGSNSFAEKGHLLQEVIIPPHTKQRLHIHHQQTEVVYLLEGEAHFYVDGETFAMHKGDSLTYSQKTQHFVENATNTPCRLLVFKINLPESGEDSEWMEE